MVAEPEYVIRVRHPTTLALITELDSYQSLEYTRTWQGLGRFQLEIGNDHQFRDAIIQRQTVIEVLRDGSTEFVGRVKVVQGRQSSDNPRGTWVLSGLDLGDVLLRRITLPNPTFSDDNMTEADGDYDVQSGVTVAQALRHYVDGNLISPAEPERVVPFLSLGTVYKATKYINYANASFPREEVAVDAGELVTVTTWKARFHDLIEVLAGLARAGDVGWDIRMVADTPALYFDVIVPADRSYGNADSYSPVVFGIDLDNVNQIEYEDNGMEVVTAVYAAGGGTLTTRVLTVENATGAVLSDWRNPDPLGLAYQWVVPSSERTWGRREGFVDFREGSSVSEIRDVARAYLADRQTQQSLVFMPVDTAATRYRYDWDLGDTVTVRCDDLGIGPFSAPVNEVTVRLTPDAPSEMSIAVGRPRRNLVTAMLLQNRRIHSAMAV